MARRSLPTGDQQLLAWSHHFATLLNSSPATYGITPAQAVAYGILHDTYAQALLACEPNIRSKAATITKNTARAQLRKQASTLITLISGTATVTEAEKIELGIALRRPASPTPIPTTAPQIVILSVRGWTIKINLRDNDLVRKPQGVVGAMLFSYASPDGSEPPSELTAWKFETITGKNFLELNFPNSLAAGTRVYLAAVWFNTRKQTGPASNLTATNLQGGTVAAAA